MAQSLMTAFLKRGPSTEDQEKKAPEKKSRREEYKEYENEKRQRSFKEQWKMGRDWLVHTAAKGMVCSVCETYYKVCGPTYSSPWVAGCTNYKLQSIREHEESSQHMRSIANAKSKQLPTGDSVAEKTVLKLRQDIVDKLVHLFRNAHAVAHESRPISDYMWICKLDIAKGLKIGETYINEFAARQFIKYIAMAERKKTASELARVKFLAVTCDGATDIATIEQEGTCVRYCDKGEIQVRFVGIKAPIQANATGIYQAITASLEQVGVSSDDLEKKLVAVGSDGASVMVGRKSGVVQLFRNIQPELIGIHCMAHRLELAMKDAVKGVSLYEKSITLLLGLYLFFKQSYLQRNLLKQCFKALGKSQMLPTRVGGTRWIGHTQRAVQVLLHGYDVLTLQLQDALNQKGGTTEVKNRARGYLKLMADEDVLKLIVFLSELLIPLSKLSDKLQSRNTTLAETHTAVLATTSVIDTFSKRETTPGLQKSILQDKTGRMAYQGVQLRPNPSSTFSSAKKRLCDGIIAALSGRFQDIQEGVVSACRIADFKQWPSHKEKSEVDEFGEEEVRILSEHFARTLERSGVDASQVSMEWILLKANLYQSYQSKVQQQTWATANRVLGDVCPNVLALVDLVLTLPASSAENERVFSKLKLLKTERRAKMCGGTLDDLLTIQLQSAPVGVFDPAQAIALWNASALRSRRPLFAEAKNQAGASSCYLAESMSESMSESLSEPDMEMLESDEAELPIPPPSAAENEDDDFDEGFESDEELESELESRLADYVY